MRLENYFDFLGPNDIRLKGTRVGIETVLFDYLELGLSPEEIANRYPTLTLEQVYATITYYWANKEKLDAYLEACRKHEEEARRAQELNPPEAVKRLRDLALKRRAA